MRKWLLLSVAVLFGFEEYRFSDISKMLAPSGDLLPSIHDLVIPLSGQLSAELLGRQIDTISRSVETKSLQRIIIIGNLELADEVKDQLKGTRVHSYRIQTGEGDLRKVVDPLTSMLTFSESRNVLICAPENVLKPILIRANEAELDVLGLASGEYLDKSTVMSNIENWLLKWRALVETI